jgi:uncharacterized protein YbaR (Trm112 family)
VDLPSRGQPPANPPRAPPIGGSGLVTRRWDLSRPSERIAVISKELLEILACPVTKMRLVSAEKDLLDQLNELISRGELRNRDGDIVVDPMEEALVREDGKLLYPIREEIPVLLTGEAIPLEGFEE